MNLFLMNYSGIKDNIIGDIEENDDDEDED